MKAKNEARGDPEVFREIARRSKTIKYGDYMIVEIPEKYRHLYVGLYQVIVNPFMDHANAGLIIAGCNGLETAHLIAVTSAFVDIIRGGAV